MGTFVLYVQWRLSIKLLACGILSFMPVLWYLIVKPHSHRSQKPADHNP